MARHKQVECLGHYRSETWHYSPSFLLFQKTFLPFCLYSPLFTPSHLRLLYQLFDLSFLFCDNFTSSFTFMGRPFALLLRSLYIQKAILISSSRLKKKRKSALWICLFVPVASSFFLSLMLSTLLSSLFWNRGQLVVFV